MQATSAKATARRRDTKFLVRLGAVSAPLTIEVVSDVICPWCYIGKRRLGKALAALEGAVSTEIRWLPFQLNPSMPAEGMPRAEYRARKFGSLERSRELDARVRKEGESEGIAFAFDAIERTPNTVAAHALVGLAQQQDRGSNRRSIGEDSSSNDWQLIDGVIRRRQSRRQQSLSFHHHPFL